MTYLFLGEAPAEKEKRIFEIRDKVLPSSDARQFDYEVLYADKLSPAVLKERLTALPTLAPHRMVVLHSCEDLSSQNRELIREILSGRPEHLVLVMTSDTLSAKDAFVQALKPLAKVAELGQKEEIDVFQLTNAMDRRQLAEALRILSELMEKERHPLQLMGVLIWFWRQKKNRLSAEKFEEGLLALQEADLNIKRSRLAPDHAMETLVVKLGKILA